MAEATEASSESGRPREVHRGTKVEPKSRIRGREVHQGPIGSERLHKERNTSAQTSEAERHQHRKTADTHQTPENLTQEVVYEEEIPIGKDLRFKVSVHKRADGTFVMNKLPTNKYDVETIKRILSKSGIGEDIEFPKKWDKLSTDKKLDFLKSVGVDTLPDFLNFRPADWGYRDQNRQGNEAYGTFVSEMEFRDLVLEKWGSLGTQLNAQQQQRIAEIDADILRRIQSNDPIWILDAYLDLDEIREEIRNDPLRQAQLDQVLTPQSRQDLANAKGNLDAHYAQILLTAGEDSLSDIKIAADQEFSTLQSNWRTIDESITRIRQITASKRELPGREGLRAWYAFRQIEMLQESYFVFKRTELQADPIENLRAAEEVMRFFEKSKTKETFDIAARRLVPMLEAVEKSSDDRVTVAIKEKLRKRFDSFQYINLLLIEMDRSEGSPDRMHKVAVEFDNETWNFFYDRFTSAELKSRDGKNYLIDDGDNLLSLNLLGEEENAVIYQYLVDRWRANRVAELSRANLNVNTTNIDESWIIGRINDLINEKITQGGAMPENLAAGEFNKVWSSNNPELMKMKQQAINGWYTERTFMGADGYENGRPRKELWLDMITQRHLRQRLVNAHVKNDRIDALLGKLNDPNLPYDPVTNPIVEAGDYDLMSAVERNGYDLAKFKLADTLDGIRIYQQDGSYLNPLWGEDTPYFARAVTDFAHWCKQEGQGDERVVKLLIEQLDANWSGADINPNWAHSGQILAQNATGARFFGMKDDASGVPVVIAENSRLGSHIKRLIDQEAGGLDSPTRDVEGYIWANQLREGIDPNNPNDINLGFTEVAWGEVARDIKSYPVHDMLFDRQAAFKWYLEKFRPWLNHPTEPEFFAMMQEYYSFRNVRRHPGMEFFIELQWKIGQHWKDWLGYEYNISDAHLDAFIQRAKELNLIDEKRAKRLKTKLLGTEPMITLKQSGQVAAAVAKNTVGSPGWWAGTVWDGFWTLVKYIATGK